MPMRPSSRQHPDFAHASVKVEGSFNGASFTFVSDLQAELKLDLSPPLVVDGSGTTDLTLFADLGTWFRDAGGNLLDPSSVSGQLVADNIAACLPRLRGREPRWIRRSRRR